MAKRNDKRKPSRNQPFPIPPKKERVLTLTPPIQKQFFYCILEAYRRIFLRHYFKGRCRTDIWPHVASTLLKHPRTSKRWNDEWVDTRTKLPSQPPIDDLVQYAVIANLGPLKANWGEISEKAIAATLMKIAHALPNGKNREIIEMDVRYLRFYTVYMTKIVQPYGVDEIEPLLKKAFSSAYMRGFTTPMIIDKMRALFSEWHEAWNLLNNALKDYQVLSIMAWPENESTEDDNG